MMAYMEVSLEGIFGATHHVNLWQEMARAIMLFFFGLIMFRMSGRRTFARMSALDLVITVVVGSILAQATTGAVPIIPAMGGVSMLVFLHWFMGHLVARSEVLARLVEGKEVILLKAGQIDEKARLHAKISLADLAEALRAHGLDGLHEIGKVQKMALEHNGKISLVKS